MNDLEWVKTYTRPIEPIDVAHEVDLHASIAGFQEGNRAKRWELEPIFDWIETGDVSLRAISLIHYLANEDRALLRHLPLVMVHGSQGTSGHRQLVALACLYLGAVGKSARFEAKYCAYAGGIADASVPEEDYFMECGTLRVDKPISAVTHMQTILIVPYDNGIDFVDTPLAYELRPLNEKPQEWRRARMYARGGNGL